MKTRRMECCVCGNHAGRWQQHWNRDTGYGICVACIKWLRGRGSAETELADLYGKEGVNWGEAARVSQVGALWVVEVPSPVCGWIVQGEHLSREAAEADSKNWT